MSRVAVLKCMDYDREKVFETVHETLALLGGIEKFVSAGQKVLLKPNMLSARSPQEAVTTHPLILEAMIHEVRSVAGEVWIGDSPSGALKGVQRCWENTGFLEVARRTGAKLINFEAGGTAVRKGRIRSYHIARSVTEADVVINLPKFKTHGFTLYTGAVKNLFGTLPGFQKAVYHKEFPHPENFSRMLSDVYGQVKAGLHLMDGVIGMEGNGPATGIKKHVGLILASADGIALDAVCSRIMGFKENEVDVVRIGSEWGLGVSDISNIGILGERLQDILIPDFVLPSNRLIKLVPQWLIRFGGRLLWVHPIADDTCTACGICARACPVRAITIQEKAYVDYKKCINCLCCNETCPEGAMVQKQSWLARKIG